jgi:hypothetical protein
MLTLATVDVTLGSGPIEDTTIYIDVDDSGWAYIKQGDDWIAFPVGDAHKVIEALQKIWR